jgi:hypothetical protein
MVKHGALVKTKVEWLVPYIEWEDEYEWKTREQLTEEQRQNLWEDREGMWVKTESGWHRSKGEEPNTVPENPLLAITVEPTFKTEFPVRHYRFPGEPYHVSLAKYWELGPNIYDPGNIMEDLIRYLHIPEEPEEGPPEWRMANATTMSLNPLTDPIATNPAARWAKAQGYMKKRDWHFSL